MSGVQQLGGLGSPPPGRPGTGGRWAWARHRAGPSEGVRRASTATGHMRLALTSGDEFPSGTRCLEHACRASSQASSSPPCASQPSTGPGKDSAGRICGRGIAAQRGSVAWIDLPPPGWGRMVSVRDRRRTMGQPIPPAPPDRSGLRSWGCAGLGSSTVTWICRRSALR